MCAASHSKSYSALELEKNQTDIERYRLAASIAKIGIWDYQIESNEHYWSPELKEILGLSELIQLDSETIRQNIDIEDQDTFDKLININELCPQNLQEDFALRYTRPGETQARWMSTRLTRYIDQHNNLIRMMAVIRDITSEVTVNEKLNYAATHDSLTKLPNRESFCHMLDEAVSKSAVEGARTGLLIIDVDHLKSVNDTYGHDVGDELLQAFANRLKNALKDHNRVARLGGDEFAYLVKDCPTKAILAQLARRILTSMNAPFQIGDIAIECRPSIGGCRLNKYCKTAKEVMKGADLALYAAKLRRRGSFVMFHGDMLEEAKKQRRAMADLQFALSNNEIHQFYQPKIDLETRQIIGLEALMRWKKSGCSEFLSPNDIQSALEEPGMAIAVFDRMIERVTQDVTYWHAEKVPFHNVAINASEGDFRSPNFANKLIRKISRKGIPASSIQLEVIESAVFSKSADNIYRTLESLRKAGIKIALDDFGTGYAALSHLQKFPIDILKIDQSFVQGIGSLAGNRAIIKAILDLGRNFKLDIIAEGVETEDQESYLSSAGCRFAQGYLYARPVPASQIPSLIRSWNTHPH